MKHARPTAPRPGPICSPQALADARHLLTHAHTMADRDPPSLKDEIKAAWKASKATYGERFQTFWDQQF